MAAFLSPEWFAALRRPDDPPATVDVVIHQTVTGDPAGSVEYTVTVAAGTVWFVPGPPSGPVDVHIVQDRETAEAIHSGRLGVDAALDEGRIRIAGDTGRLVQAGPALAAAAATQPARPAPAGDGDA